MSELGTWYAAIPIAKCDDGRFMCDYTQAIECQSAEEAVQIAAIIARKPGYSAAVAFSSAGNPTVQPLPIGEGLLQQH
jgi:hypothetical protein